MEYEKNRTNELTKQKETHRFREKKYGCWREGTVREPGMDVDTLLHLTWRTSKDLLDSTGDSAQYSVTTYTGKGSKKEWICVCV